RGRGGVYSMHVDTALFQGMRGGKASIVVQTPHPQLPAGDIDLVGSVGDEGAVGPQAADDVESHRGHRPDNVVLEKTSSVEGHDGVLNKGGPPCVNTAADSKCSFQGAVIRIIKANGAVGDVEHAGVTNAPTPAGVSTRDSIPALGGVPADGAIDDDHRTSVREPAGSAAHISTRQPGDVLVEGASNHVHGP